MERIRIPLACYDVNADCKWWRVLVCCRFWLWRELGTGVWRVRPSVPQDLRELRHPHRGPQDQVLQAVHSQLSVSCRQGPAERKVCGVWPVSQNRSRGYPSRAGTGVKEGNSKQLLNQRVPTASQSKGSILTVNSLTLRVHFRVQYQYYMHVMYSLLIRYVRGKENCLWECVCVSLL